MYPLDIVIVANDECILQPLRRELAKNDALILAEYPDVATALGSIDFPEGQRWLFVTYVRDPDNLRELQRLVHAYPTHPVATLVDNDTELRALAAEGIGGGDPNSSGSVRATMFVRAMRAGAMQVLTLPLDSDDFRSALESIAERFGPATDSTLIAISGVQGGCGATTVALNLADALAQTSGRKCVLAEFTPHLGTLASYLDCKPDYTLDDLMANRHVDPQLLKTALVAASPKLSVLCGPYRDVVPNPSSLSEADQTAVMASILDNLRRVTPIVVVELPASCDDRYFELLQKADKVLFVADQSLPSIHNLQLLEKAMLPAEHQTRHVIVNRYDPKVKGVTLSQLRDLFKTQDVWSLGVDAATTKAANEGRTIRETAPHSKLVSEFELVARNIVRPSEPQAPAGFWNWLTGRTVAQTDAKGG